MFDTIQKNAYTNNLIREVYKITEGSTNYLVDVQPMAAQFGMGYETLNILFSELKNIGLIRQGGTGRTAFIEPEGVRYVENLDLLEEKEIILRTIKYLKSLSGYRPIHVLFDAIGVNTDKEFRSRIIKAMYQKKMVLSSNHNQDVVLISDEGKRLTEHTYDEIFAEKKLK